MCLFDSRMLLWLPLSHVNLTVEPLGGELSWLMCPAFSFIVHSYIFQYSNICSKM